VGGTTGDPRRLGERARGPRWPSAIGTATRVGGQVGQVGPRDCTAVPFTSSLMNAVRRVPPARSDRTIGGCPSHRELLGIDLAESRRRASRVSAGS